MIVGLDNVALIAGRCSKKRSNMSCILFHRALYYVISLCSGRANPFWYFSSNSEAEVLLWGQPVGPTAHWSNSPLVQQPIGPTAHWSNSPLVRQPTDVVSGCINDYFIVNTLDWLRWIVAYPLLHLLFKTAFFNQIGVFSVIMLTDADYMYFNISIDTIVIEFVGLQRGSASLLGASPVYSGRALGFSDIYNYCILRFCHQDFLPGDTPCLCETTVYFHW